MASYFNNTSLLLLLFLAIILISHQVKSDDVEDNLFQGINKYRQSMNLTTFTKNQNAECFAGEIADQYKDKPCTNTTGSNTVLGTEDNFPNYPDLLAHCHLNISNTEGGSIMPACVPNLEPGLVLTNFTESQYSGSLNNTKYNGAGIGYSGNWVVLILTTNDSSGGYETDKGSEGSEGSEGSAFVSKPVSIYHLMVVFLMGCFLLL